MSKQAIVKVQTPVCRASFPSLFAMSKDLNGKEAYRLQMLFNVNDIKADPKETLKWKALKQAVMDCAIAKWGSLDKIPKNAQYPFRDGTEEKKKDLDGYGEGVKFASAKTNRKPAVVDQNVEYIMDPEQIYGGCYVRAMVFPYAWSHESGKNGVSLTLVSVQKVKDGQPFGSKSNPEEDFDALTTASDDAAVSPAKEEDDIFA